jgi:NADH-quinone oxidoreductase subunit E
MLPEALAQTLHARLGETEHPRELAVDIMMALQDHYGYLSDQAIEEGARLLGMTPLELEELATFYDFIYREPVGRYVLAVCDGVVCWMNGHERILDHLRRRLGVGPGETTEDGLFTLLPVGCIGYCDLSPAILVNRRPHGPMTPESLDALLERLRAQARTEGGSGRTPG